MKKVEKKKCYFYTRVSTEMQVDGYSLEAQYNELEREAKHRGFVLAHHFSDEGKSGKNITNRDQFREMLNAIKENRDDVSYVFVFKLSRFGRNAADVLNSVQLMQDYGVNLYCVKDNIDSASSSGKLMISVLSAVAEIERENIQEQTMAGRRQKARDGKWNGGFAPYGYALVDGKLVIDEEEAVVIREIFNKFAEGDIGLGGVAKWLTSKGYTKKIRQNGTVSNFSAHFIKGVLDNPVYMGKIAYGRRKTEKIDGTRNEYHVVKSDKYETFEGIHEGIVSEELWYKAQEKRKITGVKNEKVYSLEHEHLLTGILKCPICGASMYANISRKKKKKPGPNGEVEWYKDQYTYVCKHRKLIDGHTCTYRRQPNQEKINDEVLAVVKEFLRKEAEAASDEELDDISTRTVEQMMGNKSSHIAEKKADLERLQKLYNQKEASKDKLYEKLQNLDVCDINYDRKFDDLQKVLDKLYDEMRGIEKQISEIESIVSITKEEEETFNSLKLHFYNIMYGGLDAYSDAWKKSFLKSFIESIDIFEDDKEHGRWVKHIRFRIPIAFEEDGEEIHDFYADDSWDSVPHDETVVLLSQQKPDDHIEIEINLDELDATSAETKATYMKIQNWVQEKYGFHVTNLNIAQVKQKHGIIERENYNKPKSENSRQPGCPEEKVKAIEDALRHFQMI